MSTAAANERGSDMRSAAKTLKFSERVEAYDIGPCRLLALPTSVDSVVSWKASFCTYPDFDTDGDLLQDFAVGLLDKGTERRDRYALAEVLEERGAQLNFNGDGLRVKCRGRALRKDVPDVLALMAEQLREPAFQQDEFTKVQAQAAASLQRSMEKTSSQATGALTRRIYGEAHPNYQPDPARQLQKLAGITIEDVQQFYSRHFGATRLIVAFAGDLDPDEIAATAEECFGSWQPHDVPADFAADADGAAPGEELVPMPDKNNVDVRMGHSLSVRRADSEYIPLYVATYILGGNFSARLMATVRDEMGLTYGIGSGLSGIDTEYDGHWQVGVTLSRENLEKGIGATRNVIDRFVKEGITEEELGEKKTTITGSFEVGLATTSGLAGALLRNAERGFDIAYLDTFPDDVRALTVKDVSDVVRDHLHPEQLHTTMAGELEAAAAK